MTTINNIVWLFPIIFMLHDFEEIILIAPWRKRYQTQFKITKMKKIPFADLGDTASFSIGILIEFVIFSILAFVASQFNWYFLWNGLLFGFTMHFIMHYILAWQFKHYVPGLVSAIIFMPFCLYLLVEASKLMPFTSIQLILSYIVGCILMAALVQVLHHLMPIFVQLINRFAKR